MDYWEMFLQSPNNPIPIQLVGRAEIIPLFKGSWGEILGQTKNYWGKGELLGNCYNMFFLNIDNLLGKGRPLEVLLMSYKTLDKLHYLLKNRVTICTCLILLSKHPKKRVRISFKPIKSYTCNKCQISTHLFQAVKSDTCNKCQIMLETSTTFHGIYIYTSN